MVDEDTTRDSETEGKESEKLVVLWRGKWFNILNAIAILLYLFGNWLLKRVCDLLGL